MPSNGHQRSRGEQSNPEATDQCHLQVETAPARGLFPGIKRVGCVSMR